MDSKSKEINILVYRYLQESGFRRTAEVFAAETRTTNPNIQSAVAPPGAMMATLLKGFNFQMLEQSNRGVSLSYVADQNTQVATSSAEKNQTKRSPTTGCPNNVSVIQRSIATYVDLIDIPIKVHNLKAHDSEVYICTWNPKRDLLASCSRDGTAKIWNLNTYPSPSSRVILPHFVKNRAKGSKFNDVIALHWNYDGSLLATGTYEGVVRVWTTEGVLGNTLKEHDGPVLALKWNDRGDYVLSTSVDKRAIIWDALSGKLKQQFGFHTGPILSADWLDDTTFASCSIDKNIHVCRLHHATPIKTFRGHTDEVNEVKWNPQCTILASSSDDKTVKLWSMSKETCVHSLEDHEKEVYIIKWSPAGPGTDNPNSTSILASASYDSTIRLWDVERCTSKHILAKHAGHVYSLGFSPDGNLLASGGSDHTVRVWCTRTGSHVFSYKGNGEIYESCFDSRGCKVAASAHNGSVIIVELRKH